MNILYIKADLVYTKTKNADIIIIISFMCKSNEIYLINQMIGIELVIIFRMESAIR